MGTHLILLGVLSLCGLSFSEATPPGCRRELLEDVDFPGEDLVHPFSPDVEHCRHLCTQQPKCLFFTFIRPDWTADNRHFYCYLKTSTSGEPNKQTPLLGVTSGFSLKPCNPDPKPCLSKVYQNIDFPGQDYRSLFTASYEECQRVCTEDPGCQFFTFVNGDFMLGETRHKCHLKFSWPVPLIDPIKKTAGVVSGFSHRMQTTTYPDTACLSKMFSDTDIPGHDIALLPSVTREHCQTLCSAHPRCTYFSFTSSNFRCYLKHNTNVMVTAAQDGVTSGLPMRFCPDRWATVSYEGIDFPGLDIRHELMDDPETCQGTCTADPNCQFYTYVSERFFNSFYRRHCFLKRAVTMPLPNKVTKLDNVVSGFSLRNCA